MKSVNIYKEVVFIENSRGGAYVAEKGNKEQMSTGIAWAGNDCKAYEYENGKFQIEIKRGAGNAWSGGKLSFWSCNVIAPDGRVFGVGINASVLAELLKHNVWNCGKMEGYIWLGRSQGQVAAFTENMELFNDFKKREEVKKQKKTSDYEQGDLVGGLREQNVYLGEAYKKFDYFVTSGWSCFRKSLTLVVYKNPKKVYGYCKKGEDFVSFREKKTPMLVFDKNCSTMNAFEKHKKYCDKWSKDSHWNKYNNKIEAMKYSDNNELLTQEEIEQIIDFKKSDLGPNFEVDVKVCYE